MDETSFLLQGPAGNIEVIASPRPATSNKNITVIICHPHPLFGGTMNNKVVTTLERTFKELGLATVRFNFRGVGKSEGIYDEGKGEVQDLIAIVDWVKKNNPENSLWLAGFSFGSYVAAVGATVLPCEKLICIAPPVTRFGFVDLKVQCPWIVVQGEEDDVVIPSDVYAWVDSQSNKPVLIKIPGASHFFHGKLMELRDQLFAVSQ
jgi:alpha/beta superfamily hydrolase